MRCNKQPSNLGSSETTREAPLIDFDFHLYFQTAQPTHIKIKDSQFLQWFIGFSEGDGSFIVSKNQCSFVINQKEIALLYNIRTRLGFGKVTLYTQNGLTYGRYHVQCKKNCVRLAYLFAGNLVLKKTNFRFAKWSAVLQPFLLQEQKLKLKRRPVINLTNGWLSGFINADGGFYTRIRKNARMKIGYQVIRKFILTQADELETLEQIKYLLSSTSKVQTILNKNQSESIYYKLEVSSIKSNDLLLNYLAQYPNLGRKQVIIKVYKRLHGYIQRKEHLISAKFVKIQKLCFQLKKHNAYFNVV